MSIGGVLARIGFMMAGFPTVIGVDLVYGSAIAAAFALPQVIVYTTMQRLVSRTSGDHGWLSRSLAVFSGAP